MRAASLSQGSAEIFPHAVHRPILNPSDGRSKHLRRGSDSGSRLEFVAIERFWADDGRTPFAGLRRSFLFVLFPGAAAAITPGRGPLSDVKLKKQDQELTLRRWSACHRKAAVLAATSNGREGRSRRGGLTCANPDAAGDQATG
jgi:hypothetical protein